MSDEVEKIARLNQLKESGALTEDEFEAQKKKLLQQHLDAATQPKKKSTLSLRSPWTWVFIVAGAVVYQAVKYGVNEAGGLPTCQSEQVSNTVVELINKQIRENPLLTKALGSTRAISISSAKELHSDQAIRACEGVVKRNDGDGMIGYTIEMGDKEKGEFWVRIHGVEEIRAMYAKRTEQPKQDTATEPVTQQAVEQQPAPVERPIMPESMTKQQEPTLSPAHSKCIERAGTSMPDMIQCGEDEASRQDARLNTAYKNAMSTATDKEALKSAQRQWIKARDAECAPEEDVGGGQAALLNAAECIAIKSAIRAEELERMR